jgi:uncharacterized protein (DUF1501 family)
MSWSNTREQVLECCVHAPDRTEWPAWLPRLAFSPSGKAPRGDTLVVVFLRGAADMLNMIVPHGEAAYYRLRPTLGIARPDDRRVKASERVIDLDGFFGLHPSMHSLVPAWQVGQLAIVHACGAPDESRSHFRSMELMERGVTDERGPASGWVGRHLASLDTGNVSPLRAIGLGEAAPRSLRGRVPVTALKSIADFHLQGDLRATARMQAILSSLYHSDDELDQVGQETLEVLHTLQALDPANYLPSGGADYPASDFAMGLKQVALLVKADVGLEVAAIDLGGWDTHFSQGASVGLMSGLMQDLSGGLAALQADLGDRIGGVSVVVMSEFGRRAYENASLGTDHGHGSALLLLSGQVLGGKVYGAWPGLDDGQLFGPGDLQVTTDYRDILAELCTKRLNNPATDQIFPGFQPSPRGVFKPTKTS